MSRAVVVRGEPVFVAADVCLWNETGLQFRTRTMRASTRAVVLHWTGGEGDGRGVFGVLEQRKLSVQFAIDQRGTIYQYCDADAFCSQCGGANAWSLGIEISNRAVPPGAHSRWPREVYTDRVHGRSRQTTRFLPAQIGAALKLTRALCATYGLPFDVPRGPGNGGAIATGVLSAEALRTYRGVLGHLHVSAEKDDPGTEILTTIATMADMERTHPC